MVEVFRSLRSRNFRLFFIGQTTSLIGTWMQRIALSYYIYRTTGSPFLLGLTDFLSQIPALFLGMVGGIVADRTSKKNLFITTQTLALIQALLLALFTNTDKPFIPLIIILGFFLGVINSFDMPARNALIPLMIENKEDISNAIAMVGMMVNMARIIGSSIGGFVIEHFGEYFCFILNAISFAFVILTLFFVRIREEKDNVMTGSLISSLREILGYVKQKRTILITLSLFTITNLLAMPYVISMTIFARDVLGLSAKALGIILSALGIGAIIAGFIVASLKNTSFIGRLVPIPAIITGIAYITTAISPGFTIALITSAIIGLSLTSSIILTNSFIQILVPDSLRGRIMGIYTSLFIGIAPIGSLIIGLLAEHVGIIKTLILIGSITILSGIIATLIIYRSNKE
ncbi:MAG: MFS transporter [Thermosulfidibacteraceae bacterium]